MLMERLMRRKAVGLTFFILGVFSLSFLYMQIHPNNLQLNYNRISKLPLNISREEALTRLGAPKRKWLTHGIECWGYPLPSLAAINEAVICIDQSSSKVIYIRFDERQGFRAVPGFEKLAIEI